MSREQLLQTARPPLFPLPAYAMERFFHDFAGFDDAELAFIHGSNRNLADPTDPVGHVLSLKERPELLAMEEAGYASPVKAYRAGACLGAAIMRARVDEFTNAGFALPQPVIDPQRYHLNPPDTGYDKLTQALVRPLIGDIGQFKRDIDRSLYRTFLAEDEGADMYIGYLLEGWLGKREFLQLEDIMHDTPDHVFTGLGDVLRLYRTALAEDEQTRSSSLVYDKRRHFARSDVSHSWNDVQIEDMAYSVDLDGDPQTNELSILRERGLGSGYRAQILPGNDRAKPGKALKMDWCASVPQGVQLTHVRRFDTGYVMDDPLRQNRILPVGLKGTMQQYKLDRNDTLLVRGTDGTLATLVWPFAVDGTLPVRGNSIDLASLCRDGACIPLNDLETLGMQEADQKLHEALATTVTAHQRALRGGKLGRLLLRHEKAALGVPLALVAAYSVLKPDFEATVDTPIAFATGGIALGALRRLQKNSALPPLRIGLRPDGTIIQGSPR